MSYRPLPDGVTIKRSPIEGLGLYATQDIPANTFIGLTHILDERFENNYLRTPLGGFYNHSDIPNVRRMITNKLPNLKFGDPAPMPDDKSEVVNIEGSKEDMYPTTYARFMYMVTIRDIKSGEELAANYNLYTYPKTGVGIQMI
ncbi:SET domain-containing protein-lysine N-methyltransferase [Pelagibacterales bacterium SAG-MED15]|nr:SET domain-containing protein-lysine N-methyltransferase [Pelagibacterales bacterium SAG-MED15]